MNGAGRSSAFDPIVQPHSRSLADPAIGQTAGDLANPYKELLKTFTLCDDAGLAIEGGHHTMKVREATTEDAQAMSKVLKEIVVHTGRERKTDAAFVLSNYIDHPQSVRCTVATDERHDVIGFQSLVKAWPDNRFGVPLDWGIIGTHISPNAHRRGAGTALFAATRDCAERARLPMIDAYIGADNQAALRYYEAMGFQTYREFDDVVQKAYAVQSTS